MKIGFLKIALTVSLVFNISVLGAAAMTAAASAGPWGKSRKHR